MLNKLFVSEVRVKILKLMLLTPNRSLHVRAIVRSVGAEINAVRRELDNLIKVGILTKRQSSNRIYYTVNTDHMLFGDLMALMFKEDVLATKLNKSLKSLGEIEFLMISRAFIRGRKSTALDVDLFVVGEANLPVLEKIVKDEEGRLGREMNYSVMGSDEFKSRKRTADQFIIRLMSQGRTMLIGDEEKFCSVV